MHGREKSLESLMELTGRGTNRSRREVALLTLRNAVALAEAGGAVFAVAGPRQLDKVGMRRDSDTPESLPIQRTAGEFARTLQLAGLPRMVADLAEAKGGNDETCPGVEAGPALFVPLRLREQEWGYLAVYRPRGAAPFTTRDARTLTLLVAWAAASLDNLRLAENIEKLAVTDDLTQVYNFRYLKTALRREIKRATRFRQTLSIIMIDVDNLKSYNDRNGHLRGSFLLREMAQLFARQVRSWDLVAKYGGDEFTVILPQTERDGAMIVADRLRASVEAHAFPLAAPGSITVSLGVSVYPEDAESPATLIESADRALYRAKRAGRNRVETVEKEAA